MKFFPFAALTSSLILISCGEEAKPQPAPKPVTQQPTPPVPEPVKPVEAPVAAAPVETSAPAPVPSRPTYTVRAEIDTLPGIESSVIRLHHERIANFAGKDGKVGADSQGKPGMKPMTMGFSKGPGVSYEGLKHGDKVEVIIEMNWEAMLPEERIIITKLTKLPAETKLDFEGQRSVSDPKPPEPKPEPK